MLIPIYENGEKLEVLDPQEFLCEPIYYNSGYAVSSEIKLRAGLVQRLRKVQQELLRVKNCRLKIFDGFRPLLLQETMYNLTYEKLKKENPKLPSVELQDLTHRYFAFPDRNPLSPPPHNTGGAVDLTIVDIENIELPMGTDFDDFSLKAQTNYYSQDGRKEKNAQLYDDNRMLLKSVMEKFDFRNYPEEWWHFTYGNQEWLETGGKGKVIYGSAEFDIIPKHSVSSNM